MKGTATNLKEQHKMNRKSFRIWIQNEHSKINNGKILFYDEQCFQLDGIYNRQNIRIDADTREEVDRKGGIHRKIQRPFEVMRWLDWELVFKVSQGQ